LHEQVVFVSAWAPIVAAMNEAHYGEVERVLLYISEARERAEKARISLEKGGAEPHLVAALRASETQLMAEHRRLMQSTFYAVPSSQDRLAV
jgi:hypothetical protein